MIYDKEENKLSGILLVIALSILGVAVYGTWKRFYPDAVPNRPRPQVNFLTPDEFNKILQGQHVIRQSSPSDEDSEQAGFVAHLAEEGFRLGYSEGMRFGQQHCEDADEDATIDYPDPFQL